MDKQKVAIKVTVAIEDKEYNIDLSQDMGRPMNFSDPISFLETYIIRTSKDFEVLNALGQGFWYSEQLVYNNNIGNELADTLVDKLGVKLADGKYREAYYVLLSNPSLSSKKLSELARKHFRRYHEGNYEWYLDSDMLAAIARNPSTSASTLFWLEHCGIDIVERAAKRE